MTNPDDEEWQTTQLFMRAAGERLVLAGWANRVVDTDQGVALDLSAKGIDGMNRLFAAMKDLDPHTMRAEHVMGLFVFLTLRDEHANPPEGSE